MSSTTQFGTPRHGTNSGYVMHRQRKNPACSRCKVAHSTYNNGWNKAKRDREREQQEAAS